MIVYIYNKGVDLYNRFNGLRHRINWTYFSVLDGLAHPLYSYLTRNGKLPNRIDIWMDGKKHELFIGPVFPIKKEDEIIEEGIRLTMCFKDIKQGYYVRKTYVMENDLWYHEELYAVPLTKLFQI